jgi:glyceraldehyde-3-phosphate dehydrogenase/erythrose-4-phosphate dehydrogenase
MSTAMSSPSCTHSARIRPRHQLHSVLQVSYEGLAVDMVLECTGVFLTRAKLDPYFSKGVKKVVVSAPVKDPRPVLNVVVGCNDVSGAGWTCMRTW